MNKFNTEALKGMITVFEGGKWKGISLREYLDRKARCGCGVDCCDGTLHLVDQTTGVHTVSYISNGDWVTESYTEYLSTGADVLPGCTALRLPVDEATEVCPDAAMTWLAADNAEGYKITIGTTTGGAELVDDVDLGDVLTATAGVGMSAMNPNSEYFVTLTPYSDAGEKSGCTEISFTTLDVPAVAALTTPVDDATAIVVNADLTWNAAARATGYYVSIGTATGLVDIADAVDVNNVTTITPGSTEGIDAQTGNEEYFVTIDAYNCAGITVGVTEISFTTIEAPATSALTTPVDDATGIVVDADMIYSAAARATGYYISIGTSTGVADIADAVDVGNITTIVPGTTAGIPAQTANEEYFVIVDPYNSAGTTTGGAEISFTTAP